MSACGASSDDGPLAERPRRLSEGCEPAKHSQARVTRADDRAIAHPGGVQPLGPGGPCSPTLQISNLNVSYDTSSGYFRAVRGITFDIFPGETLALTGETGCGKSTVALAIIGLLGKGGRIESGEIRFDGIPLAALSLQQWRSYHGAGIGFVFQDPRGSLNPVLTIGQHLTETLQAHGRLSATEAKSAAQQVLNEVGIPEPAFVMNRYASELSGGMCQRIGSGLAICNRPRLLIADEPTSALDPTVQRQILDLIHGLKTRRGLALLLISHDLALVSEFADRLAVMYNGRVVEEGTRDRVLQNPAHPYTRALARCVPILNGDRREQRILVIPGFPPAAGDESTGCSFVHRCAEAGPECARVKPALSIVSEGHWAACFAAEGASDQV
jgi:oligopeptide/dipeptide ABC transporter ATP-binding protein